MEPLVTTAARIRRELTRLRRKNPQLRHLLPTSVVRRLNAMGASLGKLRPLYVGVRHTSRVDQLYHCCVQKTGSQWIKSVLTDVRFCQYTGLLHHIFDDEKYQLLPLTERTFSSGFPARRIMTPMYTTYQNWRAIPKVGVARAFFVMRDPRDLIVSWYFSARSNHLLDRDKQRPLYRARQYLTTATQKDGLLYAIDYLAERGRWETLRSWANSAGEPDVQLVRFEDLVAAPFPTFQSLFDFADVVMPQSVMKELIGAYSFERLTGRPREQEDTKSHLRGGQSGQWLNYFDADVEARFANVAGDLPSLLGY